MALPTIGDGEYVGAGNTNETLKIGKSTQAVIIGPSTGTVQIGSTGGSIGLYGKTPVAQRTYAASIHNSTAMVTSASFGTLQVAQLQEIMNTLTGIGVWATV